ncbi:MAG: hypothetical protein RJB56_811 [Actinomycetota bacterium]
MKYSLAILIGRLARILIRKFRPGGGSALPGLILSKIAPGLLSKTLSSFSDGLVVITGSAGKSTTTKMVVAIARAHGKVVFTNPSTANIAQGFYSAIIERANLFGRIEGNVAILEMDEGHAAEITQRISPTLVTVLNVLEDQLDRFVDPALVRDKLALVAARATRGVALNADDQNLLLLNRGSNLRDVTWFGVSPKIIDDFEHGLGSAPTYLKEIDRPNVANEVVSLNGKHTQVRLESQFVDFELPNRGVHYALDSVAALTTARMYLGESFDASLSARTLNELPPVFARGEIAQVNGEDVEFILVQNPMSFQLNIDNLASSPEQLMLAIGRDVHDPSWLWTVDLKNIDHVNVLSGYNYAEMGLRLVYAGIPIESVEPDLEAALENFFQRAKPSQGIKTVIFSADAMRRSRRILGFTDPEAVERE